MIYPKMLQQGDARLFATIKVIVTQPGIELGALIDAVSAELGQSVGESTVRKDIRRLKDMGILGNIRHRRGYYLTEDTFSLEEQQVLLNGLRVQSQDLTNHVAQKLYADMKKRFTRNQKEDAFLSYPVEAIANRPIARTNAGVMERLRTGILNGLALEIHAQHNPWGNRRPNSERRFPVIYPLQLIFHDIAWYVLAEDADEHYFTCFRIDRLLDVIHKAEKQRRGKKEQSDRLAIARQVMAKSWGMTMPLHHPDGTLKEELVTCRVLFDRTVAAFIEGSERHVTQSILKKADGSLVLSLQLPNNERVLFNFRRWVLSWGASAKVLEPDTLRQSISAQAHLMDDLYNPE